MFAPVGFATASAVVLLTSATFAAVALKLIVPVASAVGSATPQGAFPQEAVLVAASCTRTYFPGASRQLPVEQSGVTDQLVLVAEAPCTDQPAKSTVAVPRLKISMKSFLNCALVFPPPP